MGSNVCLRIIFLIHDLLAPMMQVAKFGVLSIAMLLIACAASSGVRAPVYSPSEINAHPKLYEGREIQVRGWVTLRAENRNIWDKKSDSGEYPVINHCLALIGVHAWTGDERINDKVLTISGVFHQYERADVNELGMCNNPSIEVNISKPPFNRR
jgi:hypothetical protein